MIKYFRLSKRVAALEEKCTVDRIRARYAALGTRNSLREKITGFPALASVFLFGFTLGYSPSASGRDTSSDAKDGGKAEAPSTLSRIKAPLIVLVIRHYLSKL